MNLWIRVAVVWFLAVFRKKTSLGEASVTSFMVLPHDIDLNIHLNNGRFLAFMDLGRLDLIIRSGAARIFLNKKWNPVVASATLRYRKSLGLFKRFDLHTRVIGSDDKFVYIEQEFVIKNELYARGAVKICFLHKKKMVPIPEIRAILPIHDRPSSEAWIQAWQSLDRSFVKDVSSSQP